MVERFFDFTSRRPGSFGGSTLGRFAEWVTTIWLRFTCSLLTVIGIVAVLASDGPLQAKGQVILACPIMAVISWYSFLLCILVCEYLGAFGRVLARLLVVYSYAFSRLVVQRPPLVDLSLTRR